MHGGEDSFINIKYMDPTYESFVFKQNQKRKNRIQTLILNHQKLINKKQEIEYFIAEIS